MPRVEVAVSGEVGVCIRTCHRLVHHGVRTLRAQVLGHPAVTVDLHRLVGVAVLVGDRMTVNVRTLAQLIAANADGTFVVLTVRVQGVFDTETVRHVAEVGGRVVFHRSLADRVFEEDTARRSALQVLEGVSPTVALVQHCRAVGSHAVAEQRHSDVVRSRAEHVVEVVPSLLHRNRHAGDADVAEE